MSARWKKELHSAAAETEKPGQCRRCGTCCAFISIPPFREDELDRLPPDIQQVVDWYTRHDYTRPQSPVPCYFYDITERACLIHEHKPQTCRDFEPGGLACRKQRSDLLAVLNNYYNATRKWAKHYTRVVVPGERIQEMAEFSLEDEIMEGLLRDSGGRSILPSTPRATSYSVQDRNKRDVPGVSTNVGGPPGPRHRPRRGEGRRCPPVSRSVKSPR